MKQITKRIIKSLMIFQVALIGVSCNSIESTYEEFVGDAERIYVGKLDSIRVFNGYQRVQVQAFMNFARTAKEVVIRWDDQEIVSSLEGLNKSDVFKLDINNLSEGSKNFTIFTRDAKGNQSIETKVFADVYGPIYITTLLPRSISSISMNPDQSLNIQWNAPELNVVETELTYLDDAGKEHKIQIDNKDKSTLIHDWKSGSTVSVATKVLPQPTDLDILALNPVQYTLPQKVIAVNVSGFEFTKDPYTNYGIGFGGFSAGLFDSNPGTFIHTNPGEGIPCHFSFDMKSAMALSKGVLTVRYNEPGDGWTPAKAELWGLKDFTDDMTDDIVSSKYPEVKDQYENKDIWAESAVANNWVKLADMNYTPDGGKGKVEFTIDSPVKVRYVMIRVTKVCGAPYEGHDAYVCLKDLNFWKLDE